MINLEGAAFPHATFFETELVGFGGAGWTGTVWSVPMAMGSRLRPAVTGGIAK
jgi:hypothetical protein